MTVGLVGRKSGMTRIFTEDGVSIPVTVIEVEPNRVTQIKTVETDGYTAIQITTGSRRTSRVNKSSAGTTRKRMLKQVVAYGNFAWKVKRALSSKPVLS